MRREILAAVLLGSGCASAPRPGPTPGGLAVRVQARDRAAARREALGSVLPLFLSDAALGRRAEALEAEVFARAPEFIGSEKIPKKGDGVVEVLVDPLSTALQKAGLIRPPGYASGPEVVLIALGDRATGPLPTERLAAEAFETALFGRGFQAQDADDTLARLKHPLKAKNEADAVAEAAAGGWPWLAAGRLTAEAAREPRADAWRAKARLSISLYGLSAPGAAPERFDADGQALDVSSFSAVSHALEQAAQEAAARVDGALSRRRAGRATLGVLISGYKQPELIRRVVDDLRRVPGVEGAALATWHGPDEMALIHVFAAGLRADALAARLLHDDASLRVDAIETQDGRVTVEGPEVPESEDRGK